MCLIMTIAAAVVFGAVFAFGRKRGRAGKNELFAFLMFSAAALMWCVDGVASVLGGEGFFDLSREDFILGVIIVASGCAVYALLFAKEKLMPVKSRQS